MKNQKSLTNKGFSLVELIIVVAIMAVLIGVLAPQYLRYVEKSRLQKDNTSIAEIADVIKMMSAEETLVSEFSTAKTFTFDGSTFVFKGSGNANIDAELVKTLGGKDDGAGNITFEVKLSSNTYTKAASGADLPIITAAVDENNVMRVTAEKWKDSVDATATTAAAPKVF